jgi:hypothetical protein
MRRAMMRGAAPCASPRWRRWLLPLAVCATALWQTACTTQRPATAPAAAAPASVEEQRTISGPTILVLVPPEARDAQAEGAAEALAHVRFALADTRRCLGAKPVRLETVFADRLVVHNAGYPLDLAPDAIGPGIGAVLIEPGRAGVVVQTMVGASSLQYQLPQAVFDYWRVRACRRD